MEVNIYLKGKAFELIIDNSKYIFKIYTLYYRLW